MTKNLTLTLFAATLAGAIPATAMAQDAAETAVIMSGTAGQAKANRSLGSAVSKSINSATSIVQSSTPKRSRAPAPRRRSNTRSVVSVIGTGDALEGTDASAYQVDSGATIKVSGGFRPSAATRCTDNCEGKSANPDE
jgi:hypothetical protein